MSLINWSRIESLIDGDTEEDLQWMRDMIQTLVSNMDTRLENILKSSNSKDWTALKSELHQMKGVAANFGLTTLTEKVVSAENLLKHDKGSEAIPLCSELPALWTDTLKELKTRFS